MNATKRETLINWQNRVDDMHHLAAAAWELIIHDEANLAAGVSRWSAVDRLLQQMTKGLGGLAEQMTAGITDDAPHEDLADAPQAAPGDTAKPDWQRAFDRAPGVHLPIGTRVQAFGEDDDDRSYAEDGIITAACSHAATVRFTTGKERVVDWADVMAYPEPPKGECVGEPARGVAP